MPLLKANGTPYTPQEINEFHRQDDLDRDSLAHHHSIGTGPFQAAPGNIIGMAKEWTPDLTNLTIGNGSISAEYALISTNFMWLDILFSYGTTTLTPGAVSVALPPGFAASAPEQSLLLKVSSAGVRYSGFANIGVDSVLLSPKWPQTGNWPLTELTSNLASGSNWTINGLLAVKRV